MGASNESGVVDNGNFQCFRWLFFGIFRGEATLLYNDTRSVLCRVLEFSRKKALKAKAQWGRALTLVLNIFSCMAFENNCVNRIQIYPYK